MTLQRLFPVPNRPRFLLFCLRLGISAILALALRRSLQRARSARLPQPQRNTSATESQRRLLEAHRPLIALLSQTPGVM